MIATGAVRVAEATSVRWPRVSLPETPTSACVSAGCYGNAEDIGVLAVVVLELRLSDVQRQILFADVVERADDRPLEDRPEALDGLSVDGADDIPAVRVA